MLLKDLKKGDIVQLKAGFRAVYAGEYFIDIPTGFKYDLYYYNDKLEHKINEDLDIVKKEV